MPAFHFLKRWQEKPPLGMRVNSGHPLAQDLGGCWLLNDGSALRVRSAGGCMPEAETLGTITNAPVYTPLGMAFSKVSTQRISFPAQTAANRMLAAINNHSVTLAAGIVVATPSSVAVAIGFGDSGNALCNLNVTAARVPQMQCRDDANVLGTAAGSAMTVSARQIISGSEYSGSDRRIYQRGMQTGSNTTAQTGNTPTTLDIGGIVVAGSAASWWEGTIEWVMCWARALSPEEHLELAVAPFGMFSRPARVSKTIVGAKPWLYYAQMRGAA